MEKWKLLFRAWDAGLLGVCMEMYIQDMMEHHCSITQSRNWRMKWKLGLGFQKNGNVGSMLGALFVETTTAGFGLAHT